MPATPEDIKKRAQCELRRAALEQDRQTFESHWRELSEFVMPRRARFVTSDNNRGEKKSQKILDGTASEAAGILSAGMMSGVTNPSRPWFRLTVADPELNELPSVKRWLFDVQTGMEMMFLRSNLYNKLPILYGDAGVFGTGAIGIFDDDEHVMRAYDFPVGSYSLGLDHKCRVRIFARKFRYTVQQIVETWGGLDRKTGQADFERGLPTNLSVTVQQAWTLGNKGQWFDIVQLIQPNDAYDGVKIESRFKRYESLYYEAGSLNAGFLEHSGYDEFPILAARWLTGGEDIYGTDCPGMRALPDIKQLQVQEKKTAQAIEKTINPPLTGPSELRHQRVSALPGDITYSNEREGAKGLRPLYEVRYDISGAENKSEQIRQRINRAFKVDLFLMLAGDNRSGITAREVDERHEEKILMLGPTLEALNDDVFDPLIDRSFAMMDRAGLIPPAPPELQGQAISVEYISIMAQAQRMVGLASLDRFAGAMSQLSQTVPDVLDRFDADEFAGMYADATGVPPKLLRSVEDAQQLRAARSSAAQQQTNVDSFSKTAGAVRDLGNAPVQGNGALAALVASGRARSTVNAAQTPVAAA